MYMLKIAFITPLLAHYRLSFWEKLSQANADYQLKIFYGTKNVEDGRPNFDGNTKFSKEGFKEVLYKIYPFHIKYYKKMLTGVKKFNPDIVILVGIAGSITNRSIVSWAKGNQKKVILWTCGWEPGKAKGILLKFKNRLVSSFFKKADFFLTYSTTANSYLESLGVNKSIIETCYNGIETDDLIRDHEKIISKSKEIVSKFGLGGNLTFLYVGGLIKEKKADMLIDAFHILRKTNENIKLLIIGDGPEKNKIEEKLNNYNDPNIHYLGRIVNDVDPYFAASDCFVLPGVGGLALNQAMFWGKPCIVSKADGTENDLVIDDISGYRFIENDLNSLVYAMNRKISDSNEKSSAMSKKSVELIINRSNVNNMVGIFVKVINRLRGNGLN